MCIVKMLYFSTTLLVIGIESCDQFSRRWLFCSPKLEYRIFSCKCSTTFSQHNESAKQGIFRDFLFPLFMRITFECSRLEIGIYQANAIKVQLKSDSNRSAVLDSPTNIWLGRSFRSNFLMWVCERAASSENLSVWGVVTLTFFWFPICVWIHPKTSMERLVWLVHFNFNSAISRVFGFLSL